MPKLIDWGVRGELIREAVIRVAASQGARGVTLEAVAAEMHLSPSTLRRALDTPSALPRMGVGLLARLRGHRRYLRGCPPGVERGSVGHIAWLLAAALPMDEEDIEQQCAWEQLTGPGSDEHCLSRRREDEDYFERVVIEALERLGTASETRREQAVLLRAVLDGLIAGRCREGVTFEEASACLEACLRELPRNPEPHPALSPSAAGSPR